MAGEEITKITEAIIGCAYEVHNTLGSGFLEKVYENALRLELEKSGLKVQQQAPIKVYYKEQTVGDYFADFLIEGCVIIEIKAVQNLTREHETQLVHYLAATGIENGLLLNFGSSVEVRRKYRTYRPKGT